MSEQNKSRYGSFYKCDNPDKMNRLRLAVADRCFEYNTQIRPSDLEAQQAKLHEIFGEIRGEAYVTPPFHCDYGFNISVGDHFYANFNCTILDGSKVTFGNHVMIAPNCVFSTAAHPIDAEQRASGLDVTAPITVGDHVWFGAGVLVLPGVTIGSGSVIGAGSVVNRDIPDGVIAVGNPCKVLRPITEADKARYMSEGALSEILEKS